MWNLFCISSSLSPHRCYYSRHPRHPRTAIARSSLLNRLPFLLLDNMLLILLFHCSHLPLSSSLPLLSPLMPLLSSSLLFVTASALSLHSAWHACVWHFVHHIIGNTPAAPVCCMLFCCSVYTHYFQINACLLYC